MAASGKAWASGRTISQLSRHSPASVGNRWGFSVDAVAVATCFGSSPFAPCETTLAGSTLEISSAWKSEARSKHIRTIIIIS